MNLFNLRKDIVEVGRRVWNRGYVASNDGNISARLDENRVLITPTGVSKGFMKEDELVIVDLKGNVKSGKKPSSEMFLHLEVYKHRPDVHGIVHSHPPFATGFAVAGIPLDKCILPEVVIALGGIPLVEYGTPGTEEFFRPVIRIVDKNDAFLLANHGTLTIGKDVYNAYYKTETLEHFAHIAFVAQQLGAMNVLNKEQVQKLTDLREKFGITTGETCVTREDAGPCDAPSGDADRERLIKEATDKVMKRLSSS
ncbi:MAG: class II aldolase/adducin family protein [Bacteroidota bacterium]|jgi:L-fuculose-phosphate aldolase